jgi:hypothetical protein
MPGGTEDDAPMDDERASGRRAAPHRRPVSARVSRVKEVRSEEARGPGHGEEEARGGLGTGRHLDDLEPAPAAQDSRQRRFSPPDEPDGVAAARELLEEEGRLPLAAAQRSAEVEGEQPHKGRG